ncbi:glycosyltransferase [Lentibacillus sp. Marseille-P4043]|uniref:glycosyltransferase n=1 Tax=Lentibacillus sp. Marseille-P4043 TaxID=2040293 RepID=UPI000D0B9B51|nr:glycosyltransferase [Lentibacillus sp. Marseille-P4043]
MSKNVCFLITEHPFLDARIFRKEAKSLSTQGYQVTMIVPRKNGYLFDVDGSIFRDQFRAPAFFHEGIKIVTYEQMYPENQIKNLHYNLHSGDHTRFTDPLAKLGIEQQADIYHAHEFFSLYSGIGVKRALTTKGKACKLIYDSHELEPDPLIRESRNTKKLKNEMLASMLDETDSVITVSESIKSRHHTINPRLPIDVIYNSPPLAPNYKPGQGRKRDLTIAFEGVIDSKRGSFRKLMDIVKLCNNTFDLKVRIIGGVKKSSKQQSLPIPSQLVDKVEFTGWQSYDAIPKAMQDVDIGWIDLDAEHSLNNRYAMPNKFFSYLNNGIPILVNQCNDMERFIEAYQCGYIVKRRQAQATDYVQALIQLHSNRKQIFEMSKNARNIMETHFSWEQMEKKLFAVYNRLN